LKEKVVKLSLKKIHTVEWYIQTSKNVSAVNSS